MLLCLDQALEDKMRKLFRNLSASSRARKAERDLSGLPEHLLKDIGFSRGHLPFIVRERNYWGRE
jgi:uncharacterized protein YjiS (DUF1127 family)